MKTVVNPEPYKWAELTARACAQESDAVRGRVSEILKQVREQGDAALFDLARSIDKVELTSIVVSDVELHDAEVLVSDELKRAIDVAADNITRFHAAQMPAEVDMETMKGVRCMQRAVPIQRVGLYVPGGSAPLFSTVLMLAIPAKVAGCRDIVLCTPPNSEGGVAPEILYAAQLCGVNRVCKVGGAQAIAAMAYGTQSIAKVDKIFGPGNRYVTEAKQQVSVGSVAIDMPAGPSEVMVMADGSARERYVAADLLSQAEHGADSQAVLVTDSRAFAERVCRCVEEQLANLSRSATARIALDSSMMIVMDSVDDMIGFANCYAAEHLIISMENAWDVASKITAAGSVFIGNYTPESAGDYASGTNHTLPTSGWARAFSGVNLDSFMRKITYQKITPEGLVNIGRTITLMAEAEGLDAHANAVNIRLLDCE